MTRFLSESLQAPEPSFRLGLKHLEKANEHPNTDIRYSAEVIQATRSKLHEFGLDGHDTTPAELYHALQARLHADDIRLVRKLRTLAASRVSAQADVNDGIVSVLSDTTHEMRSYALKLPVLRSLLKKQPPKKILKLLGYRSLDSMLKHESAVQILAAAQLYEAVSWRQRFMEQYKRLSSTDFEIRRMSVEQPRGQRWVSFTDQAVKDMKHTVVGFKELGAVVILPISDLAPRGSVTATVTLALHALNEVQAGSTYLKLCQVRPDFGTIVQTVALSEPQLQADDLDQPVPWHIVQRFYSRVQHAFNVELFESHISLHDMQWLDVEHIMSTIEPSFHVWKDTAYLGLLHAGQTVSMNLVDVALNYCNQLPFERQLRHYFQQSLWHELLVRYLQPSTVERSVLAQLQPNFAKETIMAGAA